MITLWAEDVNHKENWVSKGKHFASGCYLHGKLQNMNGYDLFDVDEKDWETLVEKGTGVERVFVNLCNGKVEIADMYFWHSTDYDDYEKSKAKYETLIKEYGDKPCFEIPDFVFEAKNDMKYFKDRMEFQPIRALVVLPWDTESVDDAKTKQALRTAFL